MPGHLFILHGDLTRVACDAWLMPTSFKLSVEEYWLRYHPDEFIDSLEKMRGELDDDWNEGRRRVLPVPNWPDDRSRPWLVNVIFDRMEHLVQAVEQFIDTVLAEGRPPRHNRDRHLFALPVISTGFGSGALLKGRVIHTLVHDLLQLVKSRGVDIVLVTYTAPAFAAAQKARFEIDAVWSELGEKLESEAKRLATVGSRQGLALFLGAGVSCSAGLPSWSGLLSRLATHIGFNGAELEEFSNLDVLDRGSVLERRFRIHKQDVNDHIARIFSRTWDYSLLHGLLACLPAAEVITQNYDRLFEVAAESASRPVATLPYTPGDVHNRWLLKMHGCVSVPEDIVIRREDYLRYSERRAALAGIVQATMLTRQMLFVGFSLRDGNFHRAVDDVRRALPGAGSNRLGTALFLAPSPLTAELWQSELDIIHFTDDRSESAIAAAARKLEIFMDCLLAHCGYTTGHLLDPTFNHLLDEGEAELKEALLGLTEQLSSKARSTEAWGAVTKLLTQLGWSIKKDVGG